MTKSVRRWDFSLRNMVVVIAIIGLSVGLLLAIQYLWRGTPDVPLPTSSNPFGNTQILTANATVVDGPGGSKNLKVDGMVSILAGQTLTGVKIELGTIANGEFKVAVPAVDVTLKPILVDNGGIYSYQFAKPVLTAKSTYSVRVMSLQRGPIGGQSPTYATVTVP